MNDESNSKLCKGGRKGLGGFCSIIFGVVME